MHLPTKLRTPAAALLTVLVITVAWFVLSPTGQAAPPPKSEDRGNGNSAAENVQALNLSTTGSNNTAHGWFSLFSNTTGEANTADGFQALFSNTTARFNTATGYAALAGNTEGWANTATGFVALNQNTTGSDNTAIGHNALFNNTTGSRNIALGAIAGAAVTTADEVIAIGTAGKNETQGCYIGFIYGAQSLGGLAVYVNADGKLGTVSSSRRFKNEIKGMDKASEAILALKPVTFHYKNDAAGTPQFGLIAEEVAKVNPDLVVRDEKGEIYTVRYEAVNAMLLNEFLKAHRRIEDQDKRIDQLTAQLEKQESLIQKVNDKVELNRSAPQTVLNDQ